MFGENELMIQQCVKINICTRRKSVAKALGSFCFFTGVDITQ